MATPFETLSNILKLERQQHFEDRVVIGGLQRYAQAWQQEATQYLQRQRPAVEPGEHSAVGSVEEIADLMAGYSSTDSREQRAEALRKILDLLEPLQAADRAEGNRPQRSAEAQREQEMPGDRDATSQSGGAKYEGGVRETNTDAPSSTTGNVGREVESPVTATRARQVISVGTAADGPVRGGSAIRPAKPEVFAGLKASVTAMPGISTGYAKKLERLGVRTIQDLLYLFPRRYDDFSQLRKINELRYGEEVTVIGTIWHVRQKKTARGLELIQAIISDGTGTIEVTWFNQPYLLQRLRPNRSLVLSGKIDLYLGRLVMQSPEWEPLEKELIHTARLVPVYPLTQGIGPRWMRQQMRRTVDHWSRRIPDHLTPEIRQRANLMPLNEALTQIHFPNTKQLAEAARHRLAFDEFFLVQLGVLRQRRLWRRESGRSLPIDRLVLEEYLEGLPFALTDAQSRALEEILKDIERVDPMTRLLQGDVGSGKTVVAAAAMLMAAANGFQAALMAPTEILAEQHHRTISALLSRFSQATESSSASEAEHRRVQVALLTGNTPKAERETLYQAIAEGTVNVVVGTQALIQGGLNFSALALVVVDEQHRFGVSQRGALRQKGYNPHMLVMSATPIPRTLSLTIYGDLDISTIDQLPPGRQSIETRWLESRERERAYSFIRSQVQRGRQAYVICPLVEGSERVEAKAAVEEYERLRTEIFPTLRLGLLHGRMKSAEKDTAMSNFHRGELDILVSTSVVEVGIDVPNATVMLVEGANRFGLAQLHQFRGRVGRGEHRSYCLLLSDSDTEGGRERLQAIENTQDGFVLAEKDLELRGPGEFFGTRQSGLPTLKLAELGDMPTLLKAREEAQILTGSDPELAAPEHQLLARELEAFWNWSSDLS